MREDDRTREKNRITDKDFIVMRVALESQEPWEILVWMRLRRIEIVIGRDRLEGVASSLLMPMQVNISLPYWVGVGHQRLNLLWTGCRVTRGGLTLLTGL